MNNEINMVCQPNFTSYGECATQLVKSLHKLGNRINLFPISQYGMEVAPDDQEFFRKCISNCTTYDYNAPSIRLWHAFDMGLRAGKGKSFAFTIFELDTFTENERIHLNGHDGVIVNSEWAKRVCLSNGIEVPVYIVPLGIDTEIFHPNYHSSYLNRKIENSTVFVHIGKKEFRKQSVILECFERAFTNNDAVELHMVHGNRILDQKNPSESKSWDNYYKRSTLADKITLYDWLPSQRDVAAKIANADCGLFPSHAEGWNFGLMQCMAAGLQVIATNYSAHTEYCNKDNTMLIEVDETEPAYDGVWFHGNGNWAKLGEPQKEQLIEYMRDVHRRKQSGENLFNTEGFHTAKHFSWENAAKRLVEVLS